MLLSAMNLTFRYSLLFAFMIITGIRNGYGQQENIWIFGTHAGLDFNSGNPVLYPSAIAGFGEANASVCNESGQLLFYTEGTTVWNRNHVIMPNGHNLTPLSVPGSMAGLSSVTTSAGQGATIVPMPDSAGKYYIFSLSSNELGADGGRLYYSIADMNLAGGMGDIMPSKKGIYLDSGLAESLVVTIGDDCNLWLITRTRNGLVYKAFEITPSGIHTSAITSAVGEALDANDLGFKLSVSPNRKKISSGKTLYDFNASTGLISNPVRLFPNGLTGDSVTYGVCFSPDNSKLYVNVQQTFWANSRICQFNLAAGSPAAINSSATAVGFPFSATDLKSGPDGKIYFISFGGDVGNLPVTTLGRINLPNLSGAACQYVVNAVPLSLTIAAYFGLPNNVPVFKRDTIIQVRNEIAPCFTDELVLSAVGSGEHYVWSDGTAGNTFTATHSGTYYVSYREPPCIFHRDTFHVSMRSPMPETGFLGSGCIGEQEGKAWVKLIPDDTFNYHYIWRNQSGTVLQTTSDSDGDTLQNLGPGLYTLQLYTDHGCDTLFTFVLPDPGHASFTADTIACSSDTLTFTNTSTPGYFTTWHWSFGDGTLSDIKDPSHYYGTSGTYNVTLTANNGECSDTATVQITLDPIEQLQFDKKKDRICIGESILFTTPQNNTPVRLHWDLGDGHQLQTLPNENVTHGYDQQGTMIVQLTTEFRACLNSFFQDSVKVYPFPLVSMGNNDTFLCLHGKPIELSNQATNIPGNYYYLWNTGEATDHITVSHPGTFSLTLTNEYGCATTETITVNKDCYIDIPNAFTPNGDSQNDYFFPRQLLSRSLKQFQLRIFDRWGQLIFETKELNGRGWDGKFNGKDQPAGVYIYLLSATFENQSSETYQGNITLIR